MKKFLIVSFMIILNQNIHALVDYSDTSVDSPKSNNKSQIRLPETNNSKSSLIWKSDLSLDTNYEMLEVGNSKVGLVNFDAHLQTPVNIFFDASYWQANSSGPNASSSGNPKFILGVNWFKVGSPSDEAAVNLSAGMRLKSQSQLASSRDDKIFGVETTKKFGVFGLGLGYEYTMTGDTARSTDIAIGSIQRIEVSSGWIVSNDIQFELSIENFKINPNSSPGNNRLNQEITFSTIGPKLNLQIFKGVNFELGARYQMKKAQSSQDLVAMKLIDVHALYSNTVYTGLNLSI